MKKSRFFVVVVSFAIAFSVSFTAYLYWMMGDAGVIEIEGRYYDPFEAETLESLLQNLPGSIPILQYHGILTPRNALWLTPFLQKRPWARRFFVTTEEFRGHLHRLYAAGFRPISLDEYLSLSSESLSSLKRLAPGTKPFVLTFDDATYGQFDFIDTNSDGNPEVDPDSAVGVLLDFHRQHPDFALTAAFSVDFSNPPFLQPSYVGKKLNMLLDYGFEIVNHTRYHGALDRVLRRSREAFVAEIGRAMKKFESYLGYRAKSINKVAYPGGHVSPEVKVAVREVIYRGRTYRFVAALHAFGLQAPHPRHSRFDAYAIPRIEISGNNLETYVLNAPHLMRLPPLSERSRGDY